MNEPDHQRSPASFYANGKGSPMLTKPRSGLTYANAMATVAVFIALGGTS